MFDLLIRNGTVIDGSGSAGYAADVAIKDGLIADIGKITGPARHTLDAEGHVVTPGFVDGHTHMDAQIFWDPHGASSCWHGVTTAVMGNCGFTLAPSSIDQRHLVIRNLERAEDISGAAMEAGIPWEWSRFSEYLEAVDRLPKGINYAANVGHSALRTWVMGEVAFEREANEDELAAMERELAHALRAGAVGFSTSLSDSHSTSDGRPVASRLASWQEVRRLVGVVGDSGHGMFELSLPTSARGADPAVRRQFRDTLLELALETGVPTTFGILAQSATAYEECEFLDRAAAAGARIIGQSHSRGISVVISFKTSMPYDDLPEWIPVRALPYNEQRRAFADPAVRATLVQSAHNAAFDQGISADALRKPDFERLTILENGLPPNPTVAEVARQRGCDPVEVLLDLAIESDLDQMFLQPIIENKPADLLHIMKHPRAVMTFSDSGAHVTQIADSSIQTHLLGHWVRGRGDFTLEEAVRMITFAPADAWGFRDRGLLRVGMVADLNIFDPNTVGPALPRLVSDLPTGARRLDQRSVGFLATIVGGKITIQQGEHSGNLPGKLLRMGQG